MTYPGYLNTPAERKPELQKEFSEYVHGDARLGDQDQEKVHVPMLTYYWRARLG
jgi:hypothetical protein